MANISKHLVAISFALTLTGLPVSVHASTITVYGSNADAHTCYKAALLERPKLKNIEACNDALASADLFARDRAAVLVNRGILHKLDDNVKGAWLDYKAALQINPKLPEALANRGNLYFLAGLFDKAMSDYDNALDYGIKNQGPVRLNRAMALGWMGQDPQARAQFEDVIKRYPKWQLAKDNYQRYLDRMAKAETKISG